MTSGIKKCSIIAIECEYKWTEESDGIKKYLMRPWIIRSKKFTWNNESAEKNETFKEN